MDYMEVVLSLSKQLAGMGSTRYRGPDTVLTALVEPLGTVCNPSN